MTEVIFPLLPLAAWRPTRDTLHIYSRLLGQVREALTARQPHWQHVSLGVIPGGLTTTPVPIPDMPDQAFEMILGLGPARSGHQLTIESRRGERWEMPLHGQSPRHLTASALAFLASMGIYPNVDQTLFDSTAPGEYDAAAVERFSIALERIDAVFKQFKGELSGDTSPVQFWTHHFDLALTWFTGRHVPGVDPANEDWSDEQMTFGFSTGDEGTPDPYFYATAYPWPDGLEQIAAPAGAAWHTAGWRGAQLMYQQLVGVGNPAEILLEFLRAAHRAGRDSLRSSR